LFGPVVAAAVLMPRVCRIRGIRDSKLIPEPEREELAAKICQSALGWGVGTASVEEISRLNILQASRLAMRRAVEALSPPADYLLVDAVSVPLPLPQLPLIHGDAKSRCIAAASILAKTERDRLMQSLDKEFPGYGVAQHKGYGTPAHLEALRRLGPCPEHRATFAPVRDLIASQQALRFAGE
jgi:ribonuclease HII